MQTYATTDSNIDTRKNTAMLLIGFLTPVVLIGSLAVSVYNSGSSEVTVKSAKKYSVKIENLSEEISVVPDLYIYNNDGNEKTLPIVLDKDDIRFGDALLSSLGRR